ncbi:hypothetical protein CPB86DRAFT_672563, partial [Serendipita vermifera]
LSDIDDLSVLADTQSTRAMSGIDKLHAECKFGAGVKVSMIDSGFEYKQPSLSGWFGCSCKFGSGYALI